MKKRLIALLMVLLLAAGLLAMIFSGFSGISF